MPAVNVFTEEDNSITKPRVFLSMIKSACKGLSQFFTKRKLLFIVLVLIYLFGGILNNMGVQIMGYYMPLYNSTFLLYGTTAMYTVMFFITEVVITCVKRTPLKEIKDRWTLYGNKKLILVVLALGFFTAFNGVFAQTAIPFVDPELTAIISQVSAPLTWIFYPLIIKKKYELGQIGAFIIILFGLLFGSMYSYFNGTGSNTTFSNSPLWIAVALCSSIPTSFETIYQEVAYDSYKAPIFIVLVYYNLFSLVVYFGWMFITMAPNFGTCNVMIGTPLSQCATNATVCSVDQIFQQQGDAFQCFFGDYDIQCCGGWQATFWTIMFTVGYYIFFVTGSFIIEKYGSNVLANLNALLFPITAIIFWIKPFVGEFYSEPKWWIIVSLIAITVGNLLYEWFSHRPLYEMDPKLPWKNLRHSIDDDKANGGKKSQYISLNDGDDQ